MRLPKTQKEKKKSGSRRGGTWNRMENTERLEGRQETSGQSHSLHYGQLTRVKHVFTFLCCSVFPSPPPQSIPTAVQGNMGWEGKCKAWGSLGWSFAQQCLAASTVISVRSRGRFSPPREPKCHGHTRKRTKPAWLHHHDQLSLCFCSHILDTVWGSHNPSWPGLGRLSR